MSIPVLLQTVFLPVLLRTAPNMYVQDLLLITRVTNSPTITPRSTVIAQKLKNIPPPISKNKSNYFSQKPKPTLALTQMNSVHKFHTIYIASFNIIFSFTSRFINYSLPSMDTALISFMRATCFTNSNFFFHFITQIPSDK